eukprot:TRINITY_DN5705_c0_g1_i1.p1 TRINITY_DN5705_c0_g1~~TRINITY_DN5705_c0_g1_i1.p1  ORF type:complete len:452 (+),score=49.36 TRINITY_DN5705_c0_g1_i1:191-1546(+)
MESRPYNEEDFLLGKKDGASINQYPTHSKSNHHNGDMSIWGMVCLSAYLFGESALTTALIFVLIPYQVRLIVGDNSKSTSLGELSIAAAIVSIIVTPIIGYLSDRTYSRFGRRRPWLIAGVCLTLFGLFLIAISRQFWLLVIGYFIEQLGISVVYPYYALLPDLVPEHQRGTAGGIMGCFTMAGNIVGGGMGFLLIILTFWQVFLVLGVIVATCTIITTVFTREQDYSDPSIPRDKMEAKKFLFSLVTPLKDRNFRNAVFSQVFFLLGLNTVAYFLQYFISDVVKSPYKLLGKQVATSADQAVAFFIFPLYIGGVVGAFISGPISNYFGKKAALCVSGLVVVCVVILMNFIPIFTLIVFLGFLAGFGWGMYFSVNNALASLLLPSDKDNAKDLGVRTIVTSIPQLISTPVISVILRVAQGYGHNLGYTIVFLVSALYMLIGISFVPFVKNC